MKIVFLLFMFIITLGCNSEKEEKERERKLDKDNRTKCLLYLNIILNEYEKSLGNTKTLTRKEIDDLFFNSIVSVEYCTSILNKKDKSKNQPVLR